MRLYDNLYVVILYAACAIVAWPDLAWPQDTSSQIQGEWRMDLRVRNLPGLTYNQTDITLIVSDKEPDGSYRVLTHFTMHAIAASENRLSRPECRGKKECRYDDGSEGMGRLIGNKFYIDWLDEGWIDDVFTLTGNKMTGDDGNGPLEFTKVD